MPEVIVPQPAVRRAPKKTTTAKIAPLAELAKTITRLKAQGKRVVHCHGVFDLVHPGHIRHFEQARAEGDVLVVTVTPDEHVNKGPGRPCFQQGLRAEAVAALQCVDHVAINAWPTAVETIRLLQPDVYVKGKEYAIPEQDITGKITEEEQAIRGVGGRLHFTDDITFSSSQLINDYFSSFPPSTQQWLRAFKRRHSIGDVTQILERTAALKVLVIGEAIIDEYVFCDGLGKSTKDPVLAFRYRSTEAHAGGSLAVANHVAGFCREVGLVTLLGELDRREDLVRQGLLSNIQASLSTHHGAPTIHKRRFIDAYTRTRLLELYMMEDAPLERRDEAALLDTLRRTLGNYDVVLVADYGHGMLTPAIVDLLCRQAKFLAVNTQANAGNRGFNTISKYPRADYVCLAGHEIALETRMRHAAWYDLVLEVTKRIDCPRFTVTQGKGGSLHYAPGAGFTEVPALAMKVEDRVGAGDAFLAVTSLLVAQEVPWDIVGFIGNVAGAQMVADLGNRTSVNHTSIAKGAIALMK